MNFDADIAYNGLNVLEAPCRPAANFCTDWGEELPCGSLLKIRVDGGGE
jgi:hypothetical protein